MTADIKAKRLRQMIADAERVRDGHKAKRHGIDALASEIRIKALKDALRVVEAQ